MNIDRIVMAIAGTVILASVILNQLFPGGFWYLLTGFVGLNLLQSAFTGFCPAAIILKKLGTKPGTAF